MERSRRAQSRMEASEDYVSQLADELALRILWYLDPKDILQVAQTCQRWRQLAEDEGLWQGKCKARGIEESLYISSATGSTSPWKSSYIRQLRVHNNWRLGRFRSITLDITELGRDLSCRSFNGKEMVCIVIDETIKIWSAVTGECLRTLVGHTEEITEVRMRDHIIVSGSWDQTVKVWNGESGECIHTLRGHTDTICSIHIHERWVASGSDDNTIRIWDIETGQCLHVLMGHTGYISYIHYDGQRVISLNDSFNLKIWDPETQSCLVTLSLPIDQIHHSELKGTRLLLANEEATITVWDIETGQCIQTMTDLRTYISAISLRANLLLWGDNILPAEFDREKFQSYVENTGLCSDFALSNTEFGPVPVWDFRPQAGWDQKSEFFLQEMFRKDEFIYCVMASRAKVICIIGGKSERVTVKVLDFDYWETD